MMMMNGFAMSFFFPKQVQVPPAARQETERKKPENKITVVRPAPDHEAEEPSIFALHAYRFY